MNFSENLTLESVRFMLMEFLEILQVFFDRGGDVVVVIAVVAALLWTLIFERIWYYRHTLPRIRVQVVADWQKRSERHSWNARQLRRTMIAEVRDLIDARLSMIRILVAICPLLGLLGTVTGMIEVFYVLAVTGGGDAKAMAGGVSRATIPTMSGMVVALSGLFANIWLSRVSERERELIADQLIVDYRGTDRS